MIFCSISSISGSLKMQTKSPVCTNDHSKTNDDGKCDRVSANADIRNNTSKSKYGVSSSNTKSTVIKGTYIYIYISNP